MASLIRCSACVRGVVRRACASKSTAVAVESSPEHESSVKPFSDMPGEGGLPIVGNVRGLMRLWDGKVGKNSYHHELHSQYGPVLRTKFLGGQWLVLVSTPEGAEDMFRAEGKFPSRSPLMESVITDMHERNNWPAPVIFAKEENWKRMRSAMKKQVIPRRVGNLTGSLCAITDDLLEELQRTSGGHVDDISSLMTSWAFQSSSYFVFGENLNVYNSKDSEAQEFITAGLEFIRQFSQIKPLPFYKYLPTPGYNSFVKATRRMRELGKVIMDKKISQWSEDIARGTVDESKAVGILEQWLIEGELDPEEALTQACDLLSAGLDTTKNTTTFLLYELAKQPALQEQLCAEIEAVLGGKEDPTWEELQSMSLVRNCLKEILRLYPAVPISIRTVPGDCVIGGYQIPAGTLVMANQSLMTHSEDYFSQPELFDPSRWSKGREEPARHPFTSLPFGFGQRGCYGRRLAELEVYILLTKLIPRFQLSTEQESIELFQSTVLTPKHPVPITFTARLS